MSALVMTNPATMPDSNAPLGWHFTSRQPMSSGASSSAGREEGLGAAWGVTWRREEKY